MIDTDALRSKVIDLAIQGKLTEQLPTDGNAEELYQQIQAEKAKLIKEQKIKKNKPLPEISLEEIPFEIPDNWKWVRWGDIVNIVSARRVHQSDWREDGIPFYRAREIARLADEGTVDNELYISHELYNELSKTGVPHEGDLMVSGVGTLGKSYVVKKSDCFYYKDASVLCFENFFGINAYYLRYMMYSELTRRQIETNSGGTTVDTLTMVRMNKYILSLPPLLEQERIVAKLDEVLAEIKIIDELQSKYASNVDVLKSKIIDAGIRGQLTEQLAEDGTAEELYQTIQEEKAQLIKDKKIKKEKPLPEITADEIPFDVPDNWKWVRIGDVVKYSLGGGTPSKNISEYWKGGDIPWASVKDFSAAEAGYLNDTIDHITQDGLNNSASNMVDENAIVICMRMALGKAVRFLRPMAINQDLRAIWLHDCVDQSYFMYLYSTIKVEGRGTTVAGIRKDELMSFLLPLPPLAEQKRIVAKINSVLAAIG